MMKIKDVIFEQGFESVSLIEHERRVVDINYTLEQVEGHDIDNLIDSCDLVNSLEEEIRIMKRDIDVLTSDLSNILKLDDVSEIKRLIEDKIEDLLW